MMKPHTGAMWAAAAVCVLLISHMVDSSSQSHIRLNTRYRFEDILISSEDESVFTASNIPKLKTFLSFFSSLLSIATSDIGRKISAEVIRVRVPSSKVAELKAAGYSFTAATWESDDTTDIMLKVNQSNGFTTIPSNLCYDQNYRIVASSEHILNKENAIRLVREFAKYRWGVLNEADDTMKQFYLDENTNEYKPSVCSTNLSVTYSLIGSSDDSYDMTKCTEELVRRDNPNGDPSEVCKIAPLLGDSLSASLLYSKLSYFCNNSTGTTRSHNRKIDNYQNRICQSKSAAEVILAHPDFAPGLTGSPSDTTEPTILFIEPNGVRKIVLVLDISGSMWGTRISNLLRAATLYVKYFVETGAELAITTFNESAKLIQPMMKVSNETDRQKLASLIQGVVAGGFTNIADAVTQSMSLLNASRPYSKSQTGFVVLLSDGEHNTGPSLDDAISNASLTSIVFDTVAISGAADLRMVRLANLTGGRGLFSSQSTPVNTELEDSFASLAKRSENSSLSRPVLLRSSVVSLPLDNVSIIVDISVKKSLNFMLHLPNLTLTSVNFTAQSPSGKLFGNFSGASVYQIELAIKTIIISIPEASIENGTWVLNAFGSSSVTGRRRRRSSQDETPVHSIQKRQTSSSTTGSIVVVGEVSGNTTNSINMDVWLRTPIFSQVTVASVQRIYAYITTGSAPLINAVVEAVVVPATGSSFSISLRDDGLGTDLTANDGIYVAVILPEKMIIVGDYSVTITMTSPVSRVASAGKFRVESLASGSVALPPGRIVDLVVKFSNLNSSISIQFTSPGNQDYDSNAPARYEVRASNSFDQVSGNFDSAQLIANLAGQLSGSKVQATLWQSNFTGVETNRTFYLAVIAVSNSALRGQPSFPVGASFSLPSSMIAALAARSRTTVTPSTQLGNSSTTSPVERPTDGKTSIASTLTTGETRSEISEWTPGLVAGVIVMSCIFVAEIIVIIVIIKS